MKKTSYLLINLAYLFLLWSCINQRDKTYKISETYRLSSSKGTTSFLSVELPISYGYQSVSDIKIENADEYFFEQKDSYQTLNAVIKGDGIEKMITITYSITLLKGKYTWNTINKNEYLLPTEFIDCDNQSIIDIASTLKVENEVNKTAQNISKYVTKNIKFDHTVKINQKTFKASEVLKNKKGVCQDYANLMTALLRASGIPAKNISGLVFNRLKSSSDWSSPAISHGWVEFYMNGKWYFADPTWGNRYFTQSDGYHLSYGTQNLVNSNENKSKINEIKNNGFTVIGGMTGPIFFTACSNDENARIIPKVDIIKQ